MQFHWQVLVINSCLWLVNILLRKFDTSKKRNENYKNTIFLMKNKEKKSKSILKHKVVLFILNSPCFHTICSERIFARRNGENIKQKKPLYFRFSSWILKAQIYQCKRTIHRSTFSTNRKFHTLELE